MFELPECVTLARQMSNALRGRRVARGELGNRPHKFVWYNRGPEEFSRLVSGKLLGGTTARGRWLFVPLEPGFVLLLGECGGRMLYHRPGEPPPSAYHLLLTLDDDSHFSVTTRMWGAMELYEEGREQERQNVQGMRPTPTEKRFSLSYFEGLIASLAGKDRRTAKGLLTQEQLVPGLGNAIAQDILFRARLHPKHPLADLNESERCGLYEAVVDTVAKVIEAGGRHDETDLYGRPGGYVRIMDHRAVGRPCPECGAPVEKISYLGGACYFCPVCQPAPSS